ncbi:dihydroorotate dehydrogenase electron transfer subunit [Burkholderia sp. MR1-5-21]
MMQYELSERPATPAGGCCGELIHRIAENQCRVLRNEWVNPEYKHLVLDAPAAALAAKPGQFFHLACPAVGGETPFLRRPMSVYRASPASGRLEFLYKVQGAGTRGLAFLAEGDVLDALGPLGRGFDVPPRARHVLLLARGVGLATLAPLADACAERDIAVSAILSARAPELVMSADYLRKVRASVHIVTDLDDSSAVPRVERLIRGIHAERPVDYAATCGSNRLLIMLQQLAKELAMAGQTALEQNMGCALGACFACVRPFRKESGASDLTYRRVCWEGPVFDLQETVSW